MINTDMSTQSQFNTKEILEKFNKMEYSKVNDKFRGVLKKSVETLKQATLQNLKATGLNITSPVKKTYKGQTYKYTPLKSGVQGEVSIDGTEGRVRIASATRKGYGLFDGEGNFALRWFEGGTKERFKKGKGYTTKANSNSSQGGSRKHRNKGASTGKLKAYHFFQNAIESTAEEINKQIEEDVNKIINDIMNEK